MGDQAEDFLMASGKLQALCYKAEIEAALRTPGFAMRNSEIVCQVIDSGGQIIYEEIMHMDETKIGNGVPFGLFAMDITGITDPQKLIIKVSIAGTPFTNSWDLWVYPSVNEAKPGNVYITDKLDRHAEEILKKGG